MRVHYIFVGKRLLDGEHLHGAKYSEHNKASGRPSSSEREKKEREGPAQADQHHKPSGRPASSDAGSKDRRSKDSK